MARGRKPIPTPLLKLRGSRHVAARSGEPAPKCEIPAVPSHLDAEAKREWRRMTKLLRDLRLISKLDRAGLAIYCQLWSRMVASEKEIQKTGAVVRSPSGYPMLNPHLSVINRCLDQLKSILIEYGMTASSRTRLRTPAPKAEGNDPFSDLDAEPLKFAGGADK